MTATCERINVYEVVTKKILESLAKGVRPWARGWRTRFPKQVTGKNYRGINVLELMLTADEKGYKSPFWMTFNQASQLKAHVKKGEKATRVVYWGDFAKATGKVDSNGEEEVKRGKFLRMYYVFNAEQISGLPDKFYAQEELLDENTRLENCDRFVKNTGANIEVKGSQPAYYPTWDRIRMPAYEDFKNADSYYSTIFHELIHWTGKCGRTDRKDKWSWFGDEAYAREELVAELGAAFLCAALGIASEPREDNASYLAGWSKILKNDKKAFMDAASAAQKAVDYLHSLQPTE
jgi:antirestriction protein ArdC